MYLRASRNECGITQGKIYKVISCSRDRDGATVTFNEATRIEIVGDGGTTWYPPKHYFEKQPIFDEFKKGVEIINLKTKEIKNICEVKGDYAIVHGVNGVYVGWHLTEIDILTTDTNKVILANNNIKMKTQLEELLSEEVFNAEFMALIIKKGKTLKEEIKKYSEDINKLQEKLNKAQEKYDILEQGLEDKDQELILSVDNM